ncbi:glycosyltransferase family 2 protein [Flavobacterium sp. MFBS3-15]|uniref:glycosyltransferase family 2 protein n=1 Tax=Flavobacterium sp. MFBS3-15 TaxID=2989816 RepID=UPI002236B902|nr:glycosyltransferase family 2 protein [Flavobacterium sp. MFBS3-15]MCW4467452.1 glycosyltransferase family 2 protein [Flavobacterium sp. MFBS3-15]
MQLSVIILNYNVRYFLELCIISVQKALEGIDGEIIVVDNNSPDDSCAMVKQRFPDITLIENKENSGFPKGNNIGVAAAKGKYICILNPDTVVAEDTFTKVLAFSEGQSNLGMVGVKFIDGTGNFLPESKRGLPTPWVALTKMSGLYKLFPNWGLFNKYYAQHLGENDGGEIDILPGAFMFMERQVYLDAGGFDERYFMYGEDVDLSYTLQKKGLRNYYFPSAAIIHYKGESTVRDAAYMKRFTGAMRDFYKKHFRGAFFMDGFLRLGSTMFIQSKKRKKAVVSPPDNYVLFSKDEELCRQLQNSIGKKVVRFAQYERKVLPSANSCTEIILDNELLPFGEIIAIMQNHRHKCYTFRIRPAGCNFVLGSDSSDGRGEVRMMELDTAEKTL